MLASFVSIWTGYDRGSAQVRQSMRMAWSLLITLTVFACGDSSGPKVGTVPALIALLSGVAATGYVAGTRIETPIVVKLTDNAGRPVPNIALAINVQGGGGVLPWPVTTGADGTATFYWTLGQYVGLNSLRIAADPWVVTPLEVATTTVPGAIVNLFVRPAGLTLSQGSTQLLLAAASDGSFNPIPNAPITWTSSNPGSVTVSPSGLVTGVAPGYSTIGASSSGLSSSAMVTVPVPVGPNGAGIPPFAIAMITWLDNSITIRRSDGTAVANLSCGAIGPCDLFDGPRWSPDGSRIALTAKGSNVSTLLVANSDGTNLHEVASAPGFAQSGRLYYPEFHEDWSSDGRLVYMRETSAGTAIETVGGDGTGRTTVMAPTTQPPRNPEWGLGDSMISVVIGGGLYGMNVDGSNFRRLVTLPFQIFMPAWSPDGNKIAFAPIPSPTNEGPISILDPTTGVVSQVNIPRPRGFCWSPNSLQLLSVSNENEPQGWLSIYTVNADGSALNRRVVAILETINRTVASWSPDGNFLLYTDDRTAGRDPGSQIYAQSISQGTNTRISDQGQLNYFDVAGANRCGRL